MDEMGLCQAVGSSRMRETGRGAAAGTVASCNHTELNPTVARSSGFMCALSQLQIVDKV